MTNVVKIRSDNIERIDFDEFEKDFSFIVNGEVYHTHSFVAYILSPNIYKKFISKVQSQFYKITSKYKGDFNKIIQYGKMKGIQIKGEEIKYFLDIMKQLGNMDEISRFYEEFHKDISHENAIQRIEIKKELDMTLDEEISFLSRNFGDFHNKYPEAILTLDADIVERIISNDQLKLHNEEELFDIVLQLYFKSKEYSTLFSYVNFKNLPTESIQKFIKNFDVNDINTYIWKKVCSRLEGNILNKSTKTHQKSYKNISTERKEKHQTHILKYLSEKCQGNVHIKNVVNITSSSEYPFDFSQIFQVENVANEMQEMNFFSDNIDNSWIKFDFKQRKVLLDHYILKSPNWSENSDYLKSWVLEVSDDDCNYKEIDRHENCWFLNGHLKSAKFQVSHSTPQRFVRLRQIGPNWKGNNFLSLNFIEFSGILFE